MIILTESKKESKRCSKIERITNGVGWVAGGGKDRKDEKKVGTKERDEREEVRRNRGGEQRRKRK